MSDECCEWMAERTDDSLKQMFQGDEAYQNGNKIKALAYLKSQIQDRLPLIEAQAIKECGYVKDNVTKMIQADLSKIAAMIENDRAVKDVHAEVMKVDKKYALPAYRAFCSCSRR